MILLEVDVSQLSELALCEIKAFQLAAEEYDSKVHAEKFNKK